MTHDTPPSPRVIGTAWLLLALLIFSLECLPFSHAVKTLILAVGIAVSLAVFVRVRSPDPSSGSGGFSRRFLLTAWVLFIVVGIFLRLVALTSLSAWPTMDEGQTAFYSLELAQQGRIRPFYGLSQLPPLFIWLQGFFFLLSGASLQSLWMFHALWSIAGMIAGMLVIRRWMEPNAALFAGGFLALGFWPNWSGRFASYFALGLFWEWIALWLLGLLIMPRSKPGFADRTWVLGIWLGLGFFATISWPGVVAFVLAAAWWRSWRTPEGRRALRSLIIALVLASFPFAIMAIREGYGAYILHASSLGRPIDWSRQVEAWNFYFSLPWLGSPNPHAYGPVWCGLFNPLAGSLVVLGLGIAWTRRKEPGIRWLMGAAFFMMIPGFITDALDAFRTMQAWPLLTVLAALGAEALVKQVQAWRRWMVIVLILSSGLFDAYHLFVRYHDTWGNLDLPIPIMKNSELAEACKILKDYSARHGRGRLLLNLRPDTYDQTLAVAAARFTRGPLSSDGQKDEEWSAALFNSHYRPFLSRRFPKAAWHDLGGRLAWPQGHLTLGCFPKGAIDPVTMERWIRADEALMPLTSYLLHRRFDEPDTVFLRRLALLYPRFKNDAFLESCFFEKAYLYFTRTGDNRGAEESIDRGLARGYPAAHFYYHLGHLRRAAGRVSEARRAYKQALSAPGNQTDAGRYLERP